MTIGETRRCLLYPKPGDDCVCAAGSDVSGSQDTYTCSDEYSKTCPWFKEWEEKRRDDQCSPQV